MDSAEEALRKAVEDAEDFMKRAPYLCYDLAKELIRAAKDVLKERTEEEHG